MTFEPAPLLLLAGPLGFLVDCGVGAVGSGWVAAADGAEGGAHAGEHPGHAARIADRGLVVAACQTRAIDWSACPPIMRLAAGCGLLRS